MQEHSIKTRFIDLTPDGLLTIQVGYAWDGPSGPTCDTKSFMRGSLIHDALYQLMRQGHLDTSFRNAADRELFRACIEDGMWKWRARWVLKALRVFGNAAALPENKKEVFEAP